MNYSGIHHCDLLNGDGIRVTLFVSGCSNNCPGCQNPETHDPLFGDEFTENTFNEIAKDLKQSWCSGLTLCGGDPLYKSNRLDVLNLSKRIKSLFPNKTIWMYTGYTLSEINLFNDSNINELLNYIDVLLDGRYIQALNSPDKKWVGSSNQHVYKVIHNKDSNEFIRIDED